MENEKNNKNTFEVLLVITRIYDKSNQIHVYTSSLSSHRVLQVFSVFLDLVDTMF